MGRELAALRNEGYLLLASGNIVHNLRAIEWDNPKGSPQTDRFDAFIRDALTRGDHATVLRYAEHPDASYAVPTPDHFCPSCRFWALPKGNPLSSSTRSANWVPCPLPA